MIWANYPHIRIQRISLKEWTLLTTMVFRDSDELQKLSHVLTFIARHIRSQWLQGEFCSPILLITRNTLHIKIDTTSHKESMILTRVVFSYSQDFKKLPHTFRLIAHYKRTQWLQKELCSIIQMNSATSHTDRHSQGIT